MQTNFKILQKQLKTIIPSMSENDLNRITKHLQNTTGQQFVYTSKQLSYKCHEGTLTFKGKKATGYGRTDQDAHLNAIKNLLEVLVEEDQIVYILKNQIRTNTSSPDEIDKENQPIKGFMSKPSINLSTSVSSQSNNDNKKSKSQFKPVVESLNLSMLKSTSSKFEVEKELQAAKIYISQLQERIRLVEEQNKTLKSKHISSHGLQTSTLQHFNGASSISTQFDNNRFSLKAKQCKQNFVRNEKLNLSVQQIVKNSEPELRKSDVKNKIPKLKLSMLPSYHGKSNKSMNQSLVIKQDK